MKKRRIEREHERDEREKEREMLQRDKEVEYHCQWEKQEDNVSAGMLLGGCRAILYNLVTTVYISSFT